MGSSNGARQLNGSGNGTHPPEEDDWDPEKAKALIGRTVLIAITMVDDDDEHVGQWQGFGRVSRAELEDGVITVSLLGSHEGEETALPAITSAFEPADPGTYTIEETGETVVDPDYIVQWTVGVPDDLDEDEDL